MGAAIVLVTLTNLVGLCFVAPITQEQNIVFMLLGATSAVLARARGQDMIVDSAIPLELTTAYAQREAERPPDPAEATLV